MAESSTPTGRKVVTVLFSDVTGSTGLGEELDPELYRQLMTRYFEAMKEVVARHGGTTEKFIGDAIVAVFGVPNAHEDDALRAARAATEMAGALRALNEEFERSWGITIRMRTGVNTGEVITGAVHGDEGYVAGGTVNIAARLEQAAQPGEILIGEATFRLVRHAVRAERLDALTVKGKADALPAWRLLGVSPGAASRDRRLDAPVIGRDQELAALMAAYERSTGSSACQLVTVVGPAGIGKSRLTEEFASQIRPSTTVVQGRCLPYGEGITFWPISEVLRDLAGIGELQSAEEARTKILHLAPAGPDAALIGERLAALLGVSTAAPAIQETFWAVRKLLEESARRSPLVVVLDDIHWGEPTFFDLLEYLVDWMHHVPVLLLCLARPELMEERPDWMRGKENASAMLLHPLTDADSNHLIRSLLDGSRLSEKAQDRIAEVADGNPLFIEEILRMLVDDGLLERREDGWRVTSDLSSFAIPATIHALLSARLDRLEPAERQVIERAAVVGRQFWWGAVAELADEESRSQVGGRLQSLIRKELIRPDQSQVRGEDAFRFAHILVRDAAYASIPKAARAHLHERFADWIEGKNRDLAGEFEEIVAYHLEQACRSWLEVEPRNERILGLARRAAVHLTAAGRRAFARGDMPAAVNLMARAETLLAKHEPARLALLLDFAFALAETGDFNRMQAVVNEATELAGDSSDASLQAEATILALWMRVYTSPEGWAEEAFRQATQALSVFEQLGNERGLAQGWSLLGIVQLLTCQFARSEAAWLQAAAHAHAAGEERQELEYLSWVPLVIWGGPTPTDEGIRRCQVLLQRAAGDRKAMSTALFTMGKFEAMRGDFDRGRALVEEARSILREVKLNVWMAGPLTQMSGWVDLLAGDPSRAERELRWGAQMLQEIGELSWLSTVAAILAEALVSQGRDQEAEAYVVLSEQSAAAEDAYSQALLRTVRAKILAHRGDAEAAEQTARQAVAIAAGTDSLFVHAMALLTLGEVLVGIDRGDQAEPILGEALRVCERKGFLVGQRRAEQLLARAKAMPGVD
jgi:class 3 adenylate cyclase/tetratricopeptide (TPR) repeat protein